MFWLAALTPSQHANTVPASCRRLCRESSCLVIRYDNLKYDLNADDPTQVDNITFTVVPDDITNGVAAATVKIQTATNGDWTTCTPVAGADKIMNVTCNYTDPNPSLALLDIGQMNVVASSTTDPD